MVLNPKEAGTIKTLAIQEDSAVKTGQILAELISNDPSSQLGIAAQAV